MEQIALLAVIVLKFVVPAFMLLFPFAGSWCNYVLDVVDGDILQSLGLNEYWYQTIDKSADYFSYIIMLVVGLRWRIRKTIIALFIYRTIGQVLFFITRNELFLFYFQNFLEPLVMIYSLLIFKNKSEEKAHASYQKHIVIIWSIILIYKIWNEWYLHFANIDLSTLLFGFNGGE